MRQKIDNYIKTLVSTKNWKVPAILGGLSLLCLALLQSMFFYFILALVELVLGLGGVLLLGYAAYLAYPELVKKYKNKDKDK